MVQRKIEHEIEAETGGTTDVLATLDEQMQNRIQLQKISEMTVEKGVMKLPVSTVTTAENSDQWAIVVEHPIEGSLRLFLQAPTEGWTLDNELVQVLDWYRINKDPYQLQLNHVYVKKTGNDSDYAHGWEFAEPPDYKAPEPPIGEQLRAKWKWLMDVRPKGSTLKLQLFTFAGAIVGASLTPTSTLTVPWITPQVFVMIVCMVAATITGLAILEPK